MRASDHAYCLGLNFEGLWTQADASGTVGTLFFAYEALGMQNWIDMRQAKLTLEGMREGVRDSDVFLLTLSEHVLHRASRNYTYERGRSSCRLLNFHSIISY